MTNNTNDQQNTYCLANSSVNDTNSSLKAQNSSLYGTNSSFISGSINMIAKLEKIFKYSTAATRKKTDVTGAITHFSTSNTSKKQSFTSDDNKRYHSCTTEHSASNPRRHSLDIFVPKTYLVNTQQVTTGMNKLVLRFKRYTYGTGHSDVSCDGMSEPNKIPLWGNKFRGLNVVVVIPFYLFLRYTTNTLNIQEGIIMPKSIRTNSKTATSTLTANQTIFDIGDVSLCPSLSSEPFTLIADPSGKRDLLAILHDGSYFYYDAQGYFVPASDTETGDYKPSLFHDTPANRQAIATLYSSSNSTPHLTSQSNQRKVIDTTDGSDDEVVLISPMELSDTACDIDGAIGLLNDIGMLLSMIYQEKMTPSCAVSMARISHDSTDTWADLLSSRLNIINKSLAQTTFGTEVAA